MAGEPWVWGGGVSGGNKGHQEMLCNVWQGAFQSNLTLGSHRINSFGENENLKENEKVKSPSREMVQIKRCYPH